MRLKAKHTRAFLAVVLVLMLGYEGATIAWGDNATISEVIWTVSAGRPIVPFLSGMLMGHFFFTPKGA